MHLNIYNNSNSVKIILLLLKKNFILLNIYNNINLINYHSYYYFILIYLHQNIIMQIIEINAINILYEQEMKKMRYIHFH